VTETRYVLVEAGLLIAATPVGDSYRQEMYRPGRTASGPAWTPYLGLPSLWTSQLIAKLLKGEASSEPPPVPERKPATEREIRP